jgi:4,4'-diaponeurosporenoate glycosyltransferase
VIIPARNEERSLPHLLRSLHAQILPASEVIVVDDHSSDRTAVLAMAAGAHVVSSAPLPEGWTGKTWACHQGATAAHGAVLCFLDADVTLAPDALARLLHEHETRGGLISVQPFHIASRPYEQLSAACNLVELMGTGAFSGRPRRPAAMAFGPCLLLGRPEYQHCGGHAHPEVRALVAEDIGLARQAAANGFPVTAFAGRHVVAFRMYPEGPRQLVEGWTKMLAYGARHTPLPAGLAVGCWVTGALLGATEVVTRPRGRRSAAIAAGLYAAWTAQWWWMLRRVGRFGWPTVIAWPAPLLAFIGLFGRSVAFRATGRPPRWRGRSAPAA